MSRKIRWIKPLTGIRYEGMIEENDDDLCAAWVKAGMAEYVTDKKAKTDAEEKADDFAQRSAPVLEKAVKESPVDRAMKPAAAKKKVGGRKCLRP